MTERLGRVEMSPNQNNDSTVDAEELLLQHVRRSRVALVSFHRK